MEDWIMKKFLLVFLFMLPLSAFAQTEHAGFVKEGKTWIILNYNLCEKYRHMFKMFLRGDTVMGNYTYKKFFKTEDSDNPPSYLGAPVYIGAFREDGSKVYYRPGGGTEACLYDFSLEAGDIFTDGRDSFGVAYTKQISYYGIKRKTLAMGIDQDSTTWIEGIGSDCRPDCNVRFTGNCDCVVACIESGDTVYFDSVYGFAYKYLTGIESMPSDTKSAVSPYYYDILGRQLSTKPEHGMYIFGGKKYVKE
jgi:hypothetical protein